MGEHLHQAASALQQPGILGGRGRVASRAQRCAVPGPIRACERPPGRGCRCGFWGLFSPLRVLERARGEREERLSVLGLVRGWGELGIHGREGFRAQRAAVACIFSDWVWEARQPPCTCGSTRAWSPSRAASSIAANPASSSVTARSCSWPPTCQRTPDDRVAHGAERPPHGGRRGRRERGGRDGPEPGHLADARRPPRVHRRFTPQVGAKTD